MYFITILRQQRDKPVYKVWLDDVLTYLKNSIKKFKVIESVYEIDPKFNQLHYHGIVSMPKKIMWKRYTRYGDNTLTHGTYRIYWTRIKNGKKNYQTIRKYMRKQVSDEHMQEQILIENYFAHNYGFDSDDQAPYI